MFNSYMTDFVVLVKRIGGASWGEKSYIRKTVQARIEDKNILIRNGAGESVMLKAVVLIKETELSIGDRMEINEIEHPVLTIKKDKSFSKTAIMEVGIG